MVKTIILIMFLAIVSAFSGRTLMLLSGILSKKDTDLFSSFSAGSLLVIVISFVSHFITVMGDGLVSTEKRYSGILMVIAMTVGYFAFVILTVLKGKKDKEKKEQGTGTKTSAVIFILIAAVLSVICFLTVVRGERVNSAGDETLETVVTFLNGNPMYTVDPLTGSAYREGLPSRYKILCLPGFYSVLCEAFGTAPASLVHSIMPGFWFVAGLFAMIALSKAIFKGSKDSLLKCSVFVSAAVLFIFAADLSPYAQGFMILSAMWSGGAVRVWLLIPFMLCCLFDRRYVLALLPVICEAFICRTQYGIGFCACIYVGYILMMLILKRRHECSEAS
ncbi:MAG: hypothetical protein K6F65_00195 [Lachnospiraceae bacterium]|nr:hypothetical protein [Lachnospiraceae bacterium]